MVSRTRILVVDDDSGVLRLVALTLFVEGFFVATADTGMEAMRLMSEDVFDMMIVDLRMPGVDCFDLIGNFRIRRPLARVIVTTKYPDDESLRRCNEAAVKVLQKPYNVHDLASMLHDESRLLRSQI